MNEVSLAALRTGRLYPPGNIMSVTPSGIEPATYRRAPHILEKENLSYRSGVCACVRVCVLTGLNRGFGVLV